MKQSSDKKLKVVAIILGIAIIVIAVLGVVFVFGQKTPSLNPATKATWNPELTDPYESITVENSFDGFSVKGDETPTVVEPTIDSQDYLCSYSSERLLDSSDITTILALNVSLPEDKTITQMVINEMYARHGYSFKNQNIQAFFDAKDWYKSIGTYTNDMDQIYSGMSDIEKANIELLQSVAE